MIGGRAVTLVCHTAVLSGRHRPNSRAAVRECFEAGVPRIEIDIHSLAGDDFIVSHEARLGRETTGAGAAGKATPDDVRAVRYIDDPDDRPPLLSEVVEMAGGCETELQLDLKDWRPISHERLRALADVVAPVEGRVIVSSGQDWNLRRLHAAAPHIAVGFDPGLYIDVPGDEQPLFLPRTVGAYGYRDDHPLAFGRATDTAAYLRERMDGLLQQLPAAREWFLSFRLATKMLDDGFNIAGWLHERGIVANVWTLDRSGAESVACFERLAGSGIDRVTTNTAGAWEEAFAAAGRRPGG